MGEIEWIEAAGAIELPENYAELWGLLQTLLDHPHVDRLKLNPVVNDVDAVSCLLAQLLPIEERVKFNLLAAVEPLDRMARIMTLLNQYSE